VRWLPAILGRLAPEVQAYARIEDGIAEMALLGTRVTRRSRFAAADGNLSWAFHEQFAEARNPQSGSEVIDVRRLVLDVPHTDDLERFASELAQFASIEVVGLTESGWTSTLGVKPWVFAFGVAAERVVSPLLGKPLAAAAVEPIDFGQAKSKNVESVGGEGSTSWLKMAAIASVAAVVAGFGIETGREIAISHGLADLQQRIVTERVAANRVRQMSRTTTSLRAVQATSLAYAVSGDRLSLELERLARQLPPSTWLESIQQPVVGRLTIHGFAASPEAWSKMMVALSAREPQGGYEKQATAKDPVEWQTTVAAQFGPTVGPIGNAMTTPGSAAAPARIPVSPPTATPGVKPRVLGAAGAPAIAQGGPR